MNVGVLGRLGCEDLVCIDKTAILATLAKATRRSCRWSTRKAEDGVGRRVEGEVGRSLGKWDNVFELLVPEDERRRVERLLRPELDPIRSPDDPKLLPRFLLGRISPSRVFVKVVREVLWSQYRQQRSR